MTDYIEHHPNCMVCGSENPSALGLRLRLDGERILGTVLFDRRQEGAPGFVHGGAIAAVFDDALGSLLFLVRKPAVTANLDVNYRAPAFIDRTYEVEVWVERVEGRKLHFAGALRESGELIAEATALFLEVEVDHFLQGAEEIPEAWKRMPR